MKNLSRLLLIIITVFSISSCKKSKNIEPVGALGPNFPNIINTIITPAILDTLKSHGTIINVGLTPPVISGTFLLQPNYCFFDNSGNKFAGTIFDAYKYNFTLQNNTKFTIQVNFKDIGVSTDVGSDNSATYISGTGNLFSIYAQITGVSQGVSYTALQVISGEMQSGGIKNFQLTHYLVSKTGDATNSILERVGSTRIFKDQDGLSFTQSTFANQPQQIQSIGSNQSLYRTLGGNN